MYGLFTDVPGDFIKKPMKDCTGKEITAEWLYHLGVPEDQIMDLAENMIRLSGVQGIEIIETGEWDIIGTTRENSSIYAACVA